MKAVIPLALTQALAWHLPIHAADALPSHLTGVWGTAESLDTGAVAQSFLHLAADGYGFAVGSAPVKRMDGTAKQIEAVRSPPEFSQPGR
ncbi:hypothetical protein [Massilia aerilata]|uniref:Uncharacterized protein n=1 Tax=Massilia aerilata TaxID=453817 RepID=A0ABW0S2G3_9BURK